LDNDDKPLLIIERKSISDLIASVKDGRYREQSHRLIHSSGITRHQIVYIIEGLFSQIRTPVEKKMVYSAMISLQIYKGFSVVRTNSMSETSDWILCCANKIGSELSKGVLPWTPAPNGVEEEPVAYCSVVKQVKKDNITPDNIGEIILSQIPSISSVSAIAVMRKFKTISHLIDSIKQDATCMDDIICESKGKTRKLGRNVKQNIIHFLLPATQSEAVGDP
jgi:ERCC4-type nuclease